MGFSRQEYRSGLPFPSPGDLPNQGIEPWSPSLQADSLPSEPPGKPQCVFITFCLSIQLSMVLGFLSPLGYYIYTAVTWVYMKPSLIPSSLSSREWISPIFIRILVLFMPCTTSYQYYSILHGTKIMFNVRDVWGFELCIALDNIHSHSFLCMAS